MNQPSTSAAPKVESPLPMDDAQHGMPSKKRDPKAPVSEEDALVEVVFNMKSNDGATVYALKGDVEMSVATKKSGKMTL